MTDLLALPPFGPRDDARLFDELCALTRHHLASCEPYRRMWPEWERAAAIADLPFVHAGVFKHVLLESSGGKRGRVLRSSGTSGAARSQIALDEESSALQAASSSAILAALLGDDKVPLLVLEHPTALRSRGEVSARVAAAMALRPLATDILFLLDQPERPDTVKWDVVAGALASHGHVRVYGFTTILWQAWGTAAIPQPFATAIRGGRIDFVHSGGWKRLEAEKVTREMFDGALLARSGAGSRVLDYYGLVEQVGVIFPLCAEGFRHVPAWADVLVRDAYTLQPVASGTGMLQLMNVLARGAPYHSVLTEDLGERIAGDCACGMAGKRFRLAGRVPRAEVRGCASV